jgi:hypothetical protein
MTDKPGKEFQVQIDNSGMGLHLTDDLELSRTFSSPVLLQDLQELLDEA